MTPRKNGRAIVLLLPGLGDALVASPIVRALQASGYELDALTMLRPVEDYAKQLGIFSNVHFADLLKDVARSAPRVFALRREHYDVAVIPFPATRWQYFAVASALGAREIVAHDYGAMSRFIAPFAKRVPLFGGHRLHENLRLAKLFVPAPGPEYLEYLVPASWKGTMKPSVIGIHPGSMVYKGNEVRRWPLSNFVAIAQRQLARGRTVRLFVGEYEKDSIPPFDAIRAGGKLEIITENLERAARSLSECEVFLGNDAGFTHIAAALGAKTLAVFGMTHPERALPPGRAAAVRESSCAPCHDEGQRDFRCALHIDHRCIRTDLTVDYVDRQIETAFAEGILPHKLIEAGPYQLYGKRHERSLS